jgi:hypothetical protein
MRNRLSARKRIRLLRTFDERKETSVKEEGDPVLRRLAEEEMRDKERELGDQARAAEMYDVPSETAADVAEDQHAERG